MKKRKTSKSLLLQMLGAILVMILIPFGIAGTFLYSQITADLTKMQQESVSNSNSSAQSLLQNFGENLQGVTKTNAYWEDFRVALTKKDISWINDNVLVGLGIIPNVNFISTGDFNGNVVAQVGDVKEFTGKLANPEIIDLIRKKGSFSGIVQTSKGLAAISASKVTDESGKSEPTGFIVFGRILDNNALNDIKEKSNVDVGLLTNQGTFINTGTMITKDVLSTYVAEVQKGQDVQVFGKMKMQSFYHVHMIKTLKDFTNKPIGVFYSAQQEMSAFNIEGQLKEASLIISAIMILILGFLAWIIYRRVIVPVRSLVSSSIEVSEGVLTNEIEPTITNRKDELGQLGNSMNIMIQNFHQLTKQVNDSIVHVANSSQELTVSAEETTKANQQIVQAIKEVADGSEVQLLRATESSKAMNNMKEGMKRISESVSGVTTDSIHAAKEAEQGNLSIKQAVKQMEHINDSFSQSTHIVSQLAVRSNEIGQITSLINDIAEQTNLLSLNAAIEAARAGEQGRGFAVVADEVRKLAEETALSTKKVSELIKVIQNESASSIQSMEKVNKEVLEGLKQIHEVGKAFENILSSTTHVAEQTQEILTVSKEMSAGTQQVASSVEEMAEIAKKSATNSLSVSSSSEEQLVSMEEITASSESLTLMAQQLKELINQFKI